MINRSSTSCLSVSLVGFIPLNCDVRWFTPFCVFTAVLLPWKLMIFLTRSLVSMASFLLCAIEWLILLSFKSVAWEFWNVLLPLGMTELSLNSDGRCPWATAVEFSVKRVSQIYFGWGRRQTSGVIVNIVKLNKNIAFLVLVLSAKYPSNGAPAPEPKGATPAISPAYLAGRRSCLRYRGSMMSFAACAPM